MSKAIQVLSILVAITIGAWATSTYYSSDSGLIERIMNRLQTVEVLLVILILFSLIQLGGILWLMS
jgi:hypothetical protein